VGTRRKQLVKNRYTILKVRVTTKFPGTRVCFGTVSASCSNSMTVAINKKKSVPESRREVVSSPARNRKFEEQMDLVVPKKKNKKRDQHGKEPTKNDLLTIGSVEECFGRNTTTCFQMIRTHRSSRLGSIAIPIRFAEFATHSVCSLERNQLKIASGELTPSSSSRRSIKERGTPLPSEKLARADIDRLLVPRPLISLLFSLSFSLPLIS